MEHYSVLLVDDEEDVFQVIMKKLDWESMGFSIAGYARNGVEALEMAEELQVDVVMTDIKMPYMDGLTLCKKLKELYPKLKVIIFSGFDEFEYAKEAIKIEAEEYILKPINANELREVFERIRNNLDREMDEKRNVDKLRDYYTKSLPILQENFYTSLIDGRISEDLIESYARKYQIELNGPYYVVAVLHISTSSLAENTDMDSVLLAVSVQRLMEEQLEGKWNSRIMTYLRDVMIIAQLPYEETITNFTDTMDKLCKMAKRVFNACVTAGIGYLCDSPAQLPASYQGAKSASSHRVIYGNTRAINIAEINPHENADASWEEPFIKKILKKIKLGSEEELRDAIQELVTYMTNNTMSLQKYWLLVMELVTEMFRFGANNQMNLEDIVGENSDIYAQITKLDSPQTLGQWLFEKCSELQKHVLHERQDTTKAFVEKAVEYVHEHYADQNLSIETICSYLNVSAAYFSTIFKKETGKTFINYLTDYRMEKALELLMTQNEKTYIIAEKVGYSDPNYFSYAFKKQFGMSPSKYKASKTVSE